MSLAFELEKFSHNMTMASLSTFKEAMGYDQNDIDQTYKCIKTYATPTSFYEGIEWLAHRI